MNLKETKTKPNLKTILVLLLTPIILTIYFFFGKHLFFEKSFSALAGNEFFDMYSHIYEYTMAFVLLFILPLIMVKYAFRDKPGNYGLGPGDLKYGLKITALAILVLVPVLYIGTYLPGIQATYPEARSVIGRLKPFLLVEVFYILYYIGWEFFFRGFMLFGLKDRFGSPAAIILQTIPSCLMHIGKPGAEIAGSILIGIVFGYLAIRTRSIIYPLLIHIFIGLFTDSINMLIHLV